MAEFPREFILWKTEPARIVADPVRFCPALACGYDAVARSFGGRDTSVIPMVAAAPDNACDSGRGLMKYTLGLIGSALLLAGCGGGGGSNSNSPPAPWQAGVFEPAADFANRCSTTLEENNWLRSWTNDLYLWFDEVLDQDPARFNNPLDYFAELKTTAVTASGAPKDKFHFTYDTAAWQALSGSGVQAGYGVQWIVIAGRPPRQVVVAYTEPNSPATAASANLARGAEVLKVDGVDVINDATASGIDTLNAGLFPANANETHTFEIRDQATQAVREISMRSANVASLSVQHVSTIPTSTGLVGYMLFNDHVAPAEAELLNAFRTLATDGVQDLILDIRYNGGGYLEIASEAAYMIAGSGPTAGKTFELTEFNSKYQGFDPVAGQPISPVPFYSQARGLSVARGTPLPSLNLPRVYLLTGPNTCSASESIINGLRGVGVEVIQIGATTCGKPYGFYPQDNCGTTYFSIEFRGVNDANFGDYTDGFSAQNSLVPTNATLPGCAVADDFTHALGDPAEARVAAALNYRDTRSCPAASALAPALAVRAVSAVDGQLPASPLRQLRILRH